MIARYSKINPVVLLTVIVLVAFFARLAAVVFLPNQPFPDAVSYRTAAEEFRNFHLMYNPEIMPLYPALIALVGPGWGQKCLDLLLSLAAVWLIYALTLKIFQREAAALIAALFAALWPHFIFFSAIGLTETLFTALLLSALWSFFNSRYLLGSVFVVLGLLTRPALEPLAPFLVVIFALIVHRQPWSFAFRKIGVYMLVYVALMSPWWLHNYAKYGEFVRLNTAGGMVLYTGNNPKNVTGGGVATDADLSIFADIKNPVRRSEAFTRAALGYIVENPGHFLAMATVKFARLWRPWPHVEDYRNPLIVFISVASFLPALLLALFGFAISIRERWRGLLPCVAIVGFLTAVHMVTLGSIRYRIPLEPFILMLAGAGALGIADRFAPKRSHAFANPQVRPS